MVSVLASWIQGSQVQTQSRPFIFKGDKMYSTSSFGREVKPEAPCQDFTTCRKSHASMNKVLRTAKFSFRSPIPPVCYQMTLVGFPEGSGGRVRNILLSTSFRHGSPCSYISWWMNTRPIGGRGPGHPCYPEIRTSSIGPNRVGFLPDDGDRL
jgi:hypothetical protein